MPSQSCADGRHINIEKNKSFFASDVPLPAGYWPPHILVKRGRDVLTIKKQNPFHDGEGEFAGYYYITDDHETITVFND